MLRLLSVLIIAIMTTAGLTYVDRSNPEAIKDLLLHIDVLGITPEGARERDRLTAIETLPIPYEQKKVLMERTVFMGASPEMVRLALGAPKESQQGSRVHMGTRISQERWIFYFKDDQRPTILEFENSVLISAYKSSALDVNSN